MPLLSVVICTHNRAESLRQTIESLVRAGISRDVHEVVVVDNASEDDTPAVVESLRDTITLRYLFEPKSANRGKGPPLNRALQAGNLGEIVAVIDDDISVEPDWLEAVLTTSREERDYDFFAGPVRVDRPRSALPSWVLHPQVYAWTLSSFDWGPKVSPLRDGGSFSGNHFWFRSCILTPEFVFPAIWVPEPYLLHSLMDRGGQGLYCGTAAVVHRIQDHLLDPVVARNRATVLGETTARLRLVPFNPAVVTARKCQRHPLKARLFCLAQLAKWSLVLAMGVVSWGDAKIRRQVLSAQGIAYYREMLRIMAVDPSYRWRKA